MLHASHSLQLNSFFNFDSEFNWHRGCLFGRCNCAEMLMAGVIHACFDKYETDHSDSVITFLSLEVSTAEWIESKCFFYGWDNTNLTFFYRLDEHIPVGFAILFLSSFFFFFWNGLLASCPWESLLGVEKTQKHAFFTWTCCAVWSYIYFLLSN